MRRMLYAGVPNIELMLFAKGVHGQLPNGEGGVGAWHERFLEWLGLLGFLGEVGKETAAARGVAAFGSREPVPQFVGPGAMRAKL